MKFTLALSKGASSKKPHRSYLRSAFVPLEDPEKSRKLIIETSNPDVRFIIVRASDVPTYVQFGGADFGVAGLDVLMEKGTDGLVCSF
jgi:ATP phosphoribosyltransferase